MTRSSRRNCKTRRCSDSARSCHRCGILPQTTELERRRRIGEERSRRRCTARRSAGESSSSMKSVLALPLLVGGNDLVGMLVFTNKIPAFTGIRQRTPHTPMQKRVHGAPATAEELMAQMPTVHASFVAERSDSAVPGFEEPRWFQAGLREAGWLEEPKDFGTGFSSRRLRAARTEEIADFAELDVELASSLIPDVTLAVAHAQLESSAAAARQTLDSPSKQNELRVNVGRVLSCAPDAALLARRACRTAALVLRAEHALLFRFEQPSLTLWRCALPPRVRSCRRVQLLWTRVFLAVLQVSLPSPANPIHLIVRTLIQRCFRGSMRLRECV